MKLTADRLDVEQGERIYIIAVVSSSRVAVASEGGLDHLRHVIEDIGFRDVLVYDDAPTWSAGHEPPATDGFDWLVWLMATPLRSMSLARDLSDELSVASAWPRAPREPFQPYGVSPFAPFRVFGVWRAFGVAYPVEILNADD